MIELHVKEAKTLQREEEEEGRVANLHLKPAFFNSGKFLQSWDTFLHFTHFDLRTKGIC